MQLLLVMLLAAAACHTGAGARSLLRFPTSAPLALQGTPSVQRPSFEFEGHSSRNFPVDNKAPPKQDSSDEAIASAAEAAARDALTPHMDGRDLLQAQSNTSNPFDGTTSVIPVIKMIVWVVDMCGKGGGPATTADAVRSLLVGGPDKTARNLADYISTCSNNASRLDVGTLTVFNLQMPCSGVTSQNNPWSVNSCEGNNMMGWFDYAEQQALSMGVDPASYTYRVMVLPNNPQQFMGQQCSWAGISTTGLLRNPAPAHGYVWLSGAAWNMLPAYLHELGHTFGIQHSATAGTGACSTCDTTSAMGYYSNALHCYNAPQNWALGWQQEIAPSLSLLSMPYGQQLTFDVPGQAFSKQSVLRVQSASANNSNVFISYRKNVGLYDTPFSSPRNTPVLLIHTYGDKAQVFTDRLTDFNAVGQTYLQASLQYTTNPERLSWTDTTTGLTVRVAAMASSGASATVTLCRPSERGVELSCFNGLDDDCDGVADGDDPDCP